MEDWGPACCGSGCAVCVLDLLDEGCQKGAEAEPREAGRSEELPLPESASPPARDASEASLCCRTGCTVCVLDLPAAEGRAGEDALEHLLAAFEGAVMAVGTCRAEPTGTAAALTPLPLVSQE